ncbi:MAG: undecaprenyl-phosphate glucose phosphotransferase [Pseudomonadota bacterium]
MASTGADATRSPAQRLGDIGAVAGRPGNSAGLRGTSRNGMITRARRLSRAHAPLSFWLQWAALLLVVPGSLLLVASAMAVELTQAQRAIGALATLALPLLYPRFGLFRRLRTLPGAAMTIVLAWLSVAACVSAGAWFIGLGAPWRDPLLWNWLLLAAGAQCLLVVVSYWLFRVLQHLPAGRVPVLIVGSGKHAGRLLAAIRRNPYLSEDVIGVVVEEPNAIHSSLRFAMGQDVPFVGSTDRLLQTVAARGADKVYLALDWDECGELADTQRQLEALNVDVTWVPDVCSLDLLNLTVREMSGLPLLSLSEGPLSSVGSAYAKSLFDVVIAGICLLLAAPIMVCAAIAVKLSSPGDVFYRQRRLGWDGSVFEILKFRSMYDEPAGEPEACVVQATKGDPRVTPIGRFLRRTSIDELPQLFNVLNGTMSLVGPRPHALQHNLDYSGKIRTYMSRHRIKPGITGLAQIHGLRGETDTVDKMRRRVAYDLQYINNWSLLHDLWILLRTPFALFANRKNVY